MPDIAILEKGGVVMFVLILMSVYALAVVFYKAFQFVQSGVFNEAYIPKVMEEVKKGELTAAEHKLQSAHGPVATLMKVAIVCVTNKLMTSKSRDAEISRVGSGEIRRLESHMRGLELVATTSPLLGLLGTVMGMVTAFAKLGEAGSRVDPAMLAGGIWEALLTTVAGLTVAIPAVAAYYIIDGVIERVRSRMQDVTVQIVALEDEYIRNEKEQERRERMEREQKADAVQEKRWKEIQEIRDIEEKRLKTLEEEGKRIKELKDIEEELEQNRGAPKSSSTLRLLNPSYNKL